MFTELSAGGSGGARDSAGGNERALCGFVFVERRHTAHALNKLIQELVNWEPDLFFVQSSHITGTLTISAAVAV